MAGGAIFTFVNGTDPDVLLVLEAAGDAPAWRFACVRLNNIAQTATRRGKTVWSCEQLTWPEAGDRSRSYWLDTRAPKPGE